MISSYIKSLKLANHLILKVPSNPTPLASLHATEKPFSHTCTANCQVSITTARLPKTQKPHGKVRKKWIKVNTSSRNIQYH